jgi:hypothetical protein
MQNMFPKVVRLEETKGGRKEEKNNKTQQNSLKTVEQHRYG